MVQDKAEDKTRSQISIQQCFSLSPRTQHKGLNTCARKRNVAVSIPEPKTHPADPSRGSMRERGLEPGWGCQSWWETTPKPCLASVLPDSSGPATESCLQGEFLPLVFFQKPDKPNKGPVLMETSGPALPAALTLPPLDTMGPAVITLHPRLS